MKIKTVDHKEVSIERDLPLEHVERVYLGGRKAHRCKHVVDGVLPRAIHAKGQVRFDVSVKGDVEHNLPCTLWPDIYICLDCILEAAAE